MSSVRTVERLGRFLDRSVVDFVYLSRQGSAGRRRGEARHSTVAEPARPIFADTGLAITVYILYLLGYPLFIPALIGVIVARVKVNRTDPVLSTHFRFQIRTFWIGLLYLVVGYPLTFLFMGVMPFVGVILLVWWFAWSLIRIVRGMVLANRHTPVPDPRSWLFGGATN